MQAVATCYAATSREFIKEIAFGVPWFIVGSSLVGYDGGQHERVEGWRVNQQQQSRRQPTRTQLLWASAAAGLLTIAILIGYRYDITLWDWIKLLVVPVAIATGGIWFNRQQQERRRAENKRAEVEARAKAADEARRSKEIHARNIAEAKRQAAVDKQRLYDEYIAAGGDPDTFEEFYKIRGPELVAEKIAARRANIAYPRFYMNGFGGGHYEQLAPRTPPSQQI